MKNINKILFILSKSQKIKSLHLFILILLGMFFETLGVGMMVPIVTLIIDPLTIKSYLSNTFIFEFLDKLNQTHIIFFGLLFIVLIYLVKTIFLIYLTWFKNQFSYAFLANISHRIFSNYLYKDWLFYIDSNSAKLIRNCNTECTIFVNKIFLSTIELIAEFAVLLGILSVLLFIEPLGTSLIFIIFCFFSFLYIYFFKNKTLNFGKIRQKLEFEKLKYLQQGFGALRDIKVINCEDFFINQYNYANKKSADVMAKWSTIQQLPRLALEIVAVLCLVTVVTSLILKNSEINKIIPTLVMFGAASLRLLPSCNRILGAFQNIRYGKVSVDVIFNELQLSSSNQLKDLKINDNIDFKKNIKFENISFSYEKSKAVTLNNINIKIPKGKFIGIIGESGAGKSTLIDIFLGLLKPISGSIKVDNKEINTNISSWQKKIGYVPQDIYLIDDTLRQNIAFGIPKNEIDDKRVNHAIKLSKLEDFVNSLKDGLNTIFGERGIKLSGGQLQRIGIARALYKNPEILVLDEATSALDNKTESFVIDSVKNLRGIKTIIIITHRITTILNSDYVYKIDKGVIAEEGKPIDIFKQ
ncbi:ABC transporter ATP-binding protein/permease [Alphaproteobacteria bacterium]|nr:ABC transporter ATP-binding protein/permease [Alphaproteobacteria bacterium]